MSGKSKIQWTQRVWNPTTGCEKVSPGCAHCYAETIAKRFWKDRKFSDVQMHDERLDVPLRWREPSLVFVDSMSDLFQEEVPFEFIAECYNTMACATAACGKRHQHDAECWTGEPHTFQILTKRPERRREFMEWVVDHTANHWPGDAPLCIAMEVDNWPLSNVWEGVSVEDRDYIHRIDTLRATPASVRFLSLEPLLGPLDHLNLEGIHWVIVGGESGPRARPNNLEWHRSVRDQCAAASVPFFEKQFGRFPYEVRSEDEWDWLRLRDPKGGDPAEWPEDLRIREFPSIEKGDPA